MNVAKFIVCLAAAIVAAMGVAGTNGVMVASHRADWQFAPENSLESLKNAIAFGADIIETDVRMTKDGHIVIMHDYAVNRTTNGSGYIGDLTLDEIRALRLRDNLGAMTLELNRKIDILSRRATADRLIAYLHAVAKEKGSREFDIPLDRQGLADYLCVERSALSAEISRLCKAGVISSRKSHFALLKSLGHGT